MKKILVSFLLAFVASASAFLMLPHLSSTHVLAEVSSQMLRDFGPVDAMQGWLLAGNSLWWTQDRGAHWQEISPQDLSGQSIQTAFFLNDLNGWLVLAREDGKGGYGYTLVVTSDAGKKWSYRGLQLFSSGDPAGTPGKVQIKFSDSSHGWIKVRSASSSNFNRGFVFITADGGETWQANPFTEDGLSSELKEISSIPPFVKVQPSPSSNSPVLWALAQPGVCSQAICTRQYQLYLSSDGGESWSALELPDGIRSLEVISREADAFQALSTTGWTMTFSGQGFDKCEIPSTDKLQDWLTNSPYKAVNLYIGGIHRACANSALSASYLYTLSSQGWRFIPTWVGPQANCSGYYYKIPLNTSDAYNLGVSEANAAIEAAALLGLTSSDKKGTVIYYDLEAFDTNNATCVKSAQSFVSGWTYQMRQRGNLAGVYSRGYELTNFWSIANRPDVIWPANWYCSAGPDCSYNKNATVWNVSGLSNDYWKDHQRIRQYAGDHSETWGVTTINAIDANVIDGVVADISGMTPLHVLLAGDGSGVVSSNPAGINCGKTCFVNFDPGSTVILTAVPDTGSSFVGWSSHCTLTQSGACQVTLNQYLEVTATFALNSYSLVVNKDGSGSGSVTSSPSGINCGSDCSESWKYHSLITLTATPASGSAFTGWAGPCTVRGDFTCQVDIGLENEVTATFMLGYLLEASKTGNGLGTITSSPAGITCGSSCQATFARESQVLLTAAASPGSSFSGWVSGCTLVDGAVCTIFLDQASSATAGFTTNWLYLPYTGDD